MIKRICVLCIFIMAFLLLRITLPEYLKKNKLLEASPNVPKKTIIQRAAFHKKLETASEKNTKKQKATDYTKDEPLDPEEETQFFREVDEVFATKVYQHVNPDDLSPYLSRLNLRLRRGVRSIIDRLEIPSLDDKEAMLKMSLVDYLVYRSRWDEKVRDDIAKIVVKPVSPIENIRFRATKIAENAELISGLANQDLDRAIDVVKDIKEPLMFRYAASAIHDSLINSGLSWNEATAKLREHFPGYNRKVTSVSTDKKVEQKS